MEKNNILSAFNGLSKLVKTILCIAIFLVIAVIVVGVLGLGKGNGLSTVSESSLREVLEISELSTAEYPYNGIATKYSDDGEKVLYHVAYEGKVTAGIDFTKVLLNIDQDGHRILITLPEVEVNKETVDVTTMDFIFLKDKYETETISKEAYDLCMEDLEKTAAEQKNLLIFAEDSAKSCIEALLEPFLASMGSDYVIEFVEEEAK